MRSSDTHDDQHRTYRQQQEASQCQTDRNWHEVVDLASKLHIGGDVRGAVRVHHQDRPAATLHMPRNPSGPDSRGLGNPEGLCGGLSRNEGAINVFAPVLRVGRVAESARGGDVVVWDTRQEGLDIGLAGDPDEHLIAACAVDPHPHHRVGPVPEAVRARVTEVDLVGRQRVTVGHELLIRGREVAGVIALGGERPAEDAASSE